MFGNPGTTELPFIDAFTNAPDLTYVLGLHEGAVVSMADGYARVTRRPAFVNLHAAAGVANGLIGMLNAKRSRTPLVVTAGQQDRRHLAQDPMLAGDLVTMASAATKSAVEVQHAYDLPLALRRAFHLAVQPPAGPVFVSIPMDVLEEPDGVPVPPRSALSQLGPAPESAIERAADLLASAERPAVVAGDGVGREGALDGLVRVAERLGATVYQQPMYDSVNFPTTHPLYAGMLPPRNAVIRDHLSAHDTLLLVGCHAFTPHHYTPGPSVPDRLSIVQLDSDATEIGRNFGVRLGLVGNINTSLRQLADWLGDSIPGAAARLEAARSAAARRREALSQEALGGYGSSPIEPSAAAHALASALPSDAILVEEAITTGLRLRDAVRQDRPGAYLHTVGGGLGWGIGAAIGAKLGAPDRPTVAAIGDGCAMFGLQGLWSAARYDVPVVFVVLNNGEYRTLKDTLDERKSASTAAGAYVGLDLAPPALDWSHAAQLFGISAVRVDRAADLRDSVAAGLASGRPTLIDAEISPHRLHN
ncbi:thiamine pyrophosphate-binding protein [Flindersiella endophytica]